MRSPENFEKSDIDKYLKSRGIWFFSPQTGGFGSSGMPDRVGCYRGKFFSIEVKRPNKEPTPIQARRIAEIQLNGGIAVWGTAGKVIAELKALFPNV